jgi:hypothetical protein
MNEAVAINVRFARQHHHLAIWATRQASKFGAPFYRELATRNRKQARAFMRSARRVRS